jgi:hypothetical protein
LADLLLIRGVPPSDASQGPELSGIRDGRQIMQLYEQDGIGVGR